MNIRDFVAQDRARILATYDCLLALANEADRLIVRMTENGWRAPNPPFVNLEDVELTIQWSYPDVGIFTAHLTRMRKPDENDGYLVTLHRSHERGKSASVKTIEDVAAQFEEWLAWSLANPLPFTSPSII